MTNKWPGFGDRSWLVIDALTQPVRVLPDVHVEQKQYLTSDIEVLPTDGDDSSNLDD